MDLITDTAVRWNGALQLLNTEIYHSGSLVQRGHGIGPLEELIMSSLLFVQPSNYYEQLVRPQGRPVRPAVRRALDFIEANLAEPITMSDIARHVNMSVRAIQQGFQAELGTTPMNYLRDRRLERVREELTDAIPADGVTVTQIAEQLGLHPPEPLRGAVPQAVRRVPLATPCAAAPAPRPDRAGRYGTAVPPGPRAEPAGGGAAGGPREQRRRARRSATDGRREGAVRARTVDLPLDRGHRQPGTPGTGRCAWCTSGSATCGRSSPTRSPTAGRWSSRTPRSTGRSCGWRASRRGSGATDCGRTETLTAPVLRCGGCDGTRVSILAGEEFLITSLELAEA